MNFKKNGGKKLCLGWEVMPSLFFLDDVTFDRPLENIAFSLYFSYQANKFFSIIFREKLHTHIEK